MDRKRKILIIDDEAAFTEMVKFSFMGEYLTANIMDNLVGIFRME